VNLDRRLRFAAGPMLLLAALAMAEHQNHPRRYEASRPGCLLDEHEPLRTFGRPSKRQQRRRKKRA
jgi:hypothetical protein